MRALPRTSDRGELPDAAGGRDGRSGGDGGGGGGGSGDSGGSGGSGGGSGRHTWGFGSFLFVDREYEGVLPLDEDPGDVRPPWLARVAS